MSNVKLTGRATSIPGGIAWSAMISIGITLLLSVTGAILMAEVIRAPDRVGIWSMMILVIASIAGAVMAATKIKRHRLQVSLLHGVVYCLFLISLTLLFFGGNFVGMSATLTVIAVGSIVGGLVTNCAEGKGSGRKHRKAHR